MSRVGWTKTIVWAVMAGPILWLGYLIKLELTAPTTALGADPGEAVVHYLGTWSLRWLMFAFSITPLFKLTRQPIIARCRRLIGLWAFAYVSLHLLSYSFFLLQFDWQALLVDLVERSYITAGMLAFVLLLAMAVTSTQGWRVRLGKNWKRLHLVMYPAVAAAIVHFLWYTRDQFAEVYFYVAWFVVLLAIRAYYNYFALPRRARTA